MAKPKRRWSWTPKNLRKTLSKDQRYNDINKIFKCNGGKGSWKTNRIHLKKMDKIIAYYAKYEWTYFDSSAFYGDRGIEYLPKEHEHILLWYTIENGKSWYDHTYRIKDNFDITPFPKEVYKYDFRGYLGDVTPLLKTYEAMDVGLKKHPRAWAQWDHPYW